MKIAFYAPLKNPEHSIPSGDRSIARLFMSALIKEGHEIFLASKFRSYNKNPKEQIKIKKKSIKEIEKFLNIFEKNLPELWFTYHLYYKAPDYLGPIISKLLSIPYIIAEASYSPKRNEDDWKFGNQQVLSAIKSSDGILHLNTRDINCINPILNNTAKTFYIPPFINHEKFSVEYKEKKKIKTKLTKKIGIPPDTVLLLTVAMMRNDNSKLPSYIFLSQVLQFVEKDFYLLVAGDGESRNTVFQILNKSTRKKVKFFGTVEEKRLLELYKAADIFVWPGINEAFGISYLEAQSAKLPVIANNFGGISNMLKINETGFLIKQDDKENFAKNIDLLINNPNLRQNMGTNGSFFVKNERSIESTSKDIHKAIVQVSYNFKCR